MPVLELKTNVKVENVKDFVVQLSDFAQNLLKKKKEYMSVDYVYSENLAFAGTFDPTYVLTVNFLLMNPDENDHLTIEFTKFLKEKIGVPSDRGYVVFNDPGLDQVGLYGRLIKVLFPNAK